LLIAVAAVDVVAVVIEVVEAAVLVPVVVAFESAAALIGFVSFSFVAAVSLFSLLSSSGASHGALLCSPNQNAFWLIRIKKKPARHNILRSVFFFFTHGQRQAWQQRIANDPGLCDCKR
jgi:hypothetical protein